MELVITAHSETFNHYMQENPGMLDRTGIEPKYFAQVLLGLATPRTFPVTENLMPEGFMTV